MNTGDVVAIPMADNTIHILKILRIDSDPRMGETFHCTSYEPVAALPAQADMGRLKIGCWHAPISGESIRKQGKVLFNVPVAREDLKGYFVYLKETDIRRWSEETGVDLDQLFDEAKQHYVEGCGLADREQFREAIEAYTEAIELFPLFMEAIDNRGLAYMDLHEWDNAMVDFRESMAKFPDSPVAMFSYGECLLRKDKLEEAEKLFSEGKKRWPEDPHFTAMMKALGKHKRAQKPWWKFW